MIMEVYTHYIEQRKPSTKMENYMDNMYNYVIGKQKKEKPTENDNNIITIDFTKRFAYPTFCHKKSRLWNRFR